MREIECFDCGSSMEIARYTNDSHELILCDDCAEGDLYYEELACCPSDAIRTEIEA